MKDIIVVCYATHRAGLLDEYEQQLKDAGIPLHIEPVTLPDGINSVTARWKFEYMRQMCERFADYDRIVFTDAWDVMFYGPKEQLYWFIPPFLMSAERNCWPDECYEANANRPPWKYPNAGMIAGYPEYISEWLSARADTLMLDSMEQMWCNFRVHHDASSIPLDTRTTLFYTVSADKEDSSLSTALSEPYNRRYKTFPQFFHFSGKCPTEPFRAMLRGEVDALR